jgi:serine/threonine-protein kinase HipA
MKLIIHMHNERVGVLEQPEFNRFVFTYDTGAKHPISLTMPVRAEPYVAPFLHPVFQTNLPQGRLRQIIENELGKRMNTAGDMQVLSVVGSHLVGAIKAVPESTDASHDGVIIENLSDILASKADKRFIDAFMTRHAAQSGVSGSFDKALTTLINEGGHHAINTTRSIIKFDDDDHPSLSVIEYFSMEMARRVGLNVSNVFLNNNGKMLIVERFDVSGASRTPHAFEDMCSLLGLPSDHKFMGSVEKIITTIKNYCSKQEVPSALRQFFTQYAACSIMRNGDAHLKNFGLLTNADTGITSLSPCYDMVTTSVYAPTVNGQADDYMALSFNETKQWLSMKSLVALGTRCGMTKEQIGETVNGIHVAMHGIVAEVAGYAEDHPEHENGLRKMLERWVEGLGHVGCDLSEWEDMKPQKYARPKMA